jgi:hypothetical protein
MKRIILLIGLMVFKASAAVSPRLAIVISKTGFSQKWGVTQMAAHGWGAAANLAGIPYNCLFLEDLSETDLTRYGLLILAQCGYAPDSGYPLLIGALQTYLGRGGHIIVDGPLAIFDETAREREHAGLDSLLGVHYDGFRCDDRYRIRVKTGDHYVTRDYKADQFLTQHLVGGLNILSGGDTLLESTNGRKRHPFLSVLAKGNSRLVFISDFSTWAGAASFFRNAQPQVFYRNELFNVLIRAIHWSLYGTPLTPFPVPQISNANLTAIIRLDADGSGNLNEQITTINYLVELAGESGVMPVYGWVSSQAAKAGWQDLAPLGKKLEDAGGEIATHSRFHRIDADMNETRWRDELDESIREIEFNTADYDYPIGKVESFINPGNTIRMDDYEQIAKRFSFYMTHGFEQDMPLGFGNFTWFTGGRQNLALLEDTPSPDYQWFYDPAWSYTTQQITAYQEAVFDHMFERIGRGVIFNQMWHDYSITSQPQSGKTRIVNSSNLAMYDAIRNKFAVKEIYCPTPVELGHKLRLMAQWDYDWRAEKDRLCMTLDLTRVNLDTMPRFTGGMGIAIENSPQTIQNVLIDGQPHEAFGDRLVILPNLSKSRHTLEIRLGDHPAAQPRLVYVSQLMPYCRRTGDGLELALVTRNKARFRFHAPPGYVLLNADYQVRDPLFTDRLSGFVTSDRKVFLNKIPGSSFSVYKSTLAIESIKCEQNKVTLKMKNNGCEFNQFWFRASSVPKSVRCGDRSVPWIESGSTYQMTTPRMEKDEEIVIQL